MKTNPKRRKVEPNKLEVPNKKTELAPVLLKLYNKQPNAFIKTQIPQLLVLLDHTSVKGSIQAHQWKEQLNTVEKLWFSIPYPRRASTKKLFIGLIIVVWQVIEQMPPEKQRMLLFFWTSVKYLPAEGFGGLGSKLYIYKSSESQNRLPSSHTCFYRLCLPAYSSLSTMRSRLSMITQDHVSCTFGTW